MIDFNKPYFTGKETDYIRQAVNSGKISGNGEFSEKCHHFLEKKYGFPKCLLTTSCTDALEMSAILINIRQGDEVIMPSYTFVSTANAFVLHGAKIIFADSSPDNPNLDAGKIEELVTPKTKAIVPVHYAGIACDMDKITEIAQKNNLFVIEDSAQAIDSFYKEKALGSLGHLSAFSFHETKNIISGEGGMLVINKEEFLKRAEIIWEKGTNRASFWRGEIDKYGWVDIGSSFLPSEIIAAFSFAQLEKTEDAQNKRKKIWNMYYQGLKSLEEMGIIKLPFIPSYATNNAHMFYVVCNDLNERTNLVAFLKNKNIHSVFHYQSLHKSPFYKDKHDGRELPMSDLYADCLVRLPMYFELQEEKVMKVIEEIRKFYHK